MSIPKKVAEDMGLVQLLRFDVKNNKMTTQYGYITHHKWLEKEKERIESRPGRKAIITEDEFITHKDRKPVKKYALYVNPVEGVIQ